MCKFRQRLPRGKKRRLLQYFLNVLREAVSNLTSALSKKLLSMNFPFLEEYFPQGFMSLKRNGLIHLNSLTDYAILCEHYWPPDFPLCLVYGKVIGQKGAFPAVHSSFSATPKFCWVWSQWLNPGLCVPLELDPSKTLPSQSDSFVVKRGKCRQ